MLSFVTGTGDSRKTGRNVGGGGEKNLLLLDFFLCLVGHVDTGRQWFNLVEVNDLV